jgi:hypothetical protein
MGNEDDMVFFKFEEIYSHGDIHFGRKVTVVWMTHEKMDLVLYI